MRASIRQILKDNGFTIASIASALYQVWSTVKQNEVNAAQSAKSNIIESKIDKLNQSQQVLIKKLTSEDDSIVSTKEIPNVSTQRLVNMSEEELKQRSMEEATNMRSLLEKTEIYKKYESFQKEQKLNESKLESINKKLENKSLNHDEIEKIREQKTEAMSKLDESKKSLTKSESTVIDDLSDDIEKTENSQWDLFLEDFYNSYWDYLESLSLSQLISFVNLGFSFGIFINSFNLVVLLWCDKIIENFNLEIRFPKIARYLKHRQKVQKFKFTVLVTLVILFYIGQIISNIWFLSIL